MFIFYWRCECPSRRRHQHRNLRTHLGSMGMSRPRGAPDEPSAIGPIHSERVTDGECMLYHSGLESVTALKSPRDRCRWPRSSGIRRAPPTGRDDVSNFAERVTGSTTLDLALQMLERRDRRAPWLESRKAEARDDEKPLLFLGRRLECDQGVVIAHAKCGGTYLCSQGTSPNRWRISADGAVPFGPHPRPMPPPPTTTATH